MRVVIVRRESGVALSMDVYTNNLVAQLKQLRPTWKIIEIAPKPWSDTQENLWHSGTGLRKYYERFWSHPRQVSQLEGDIYHIVDHSNAHVAYWLKNTGKPIVVTCHDLVQFVYPEILKGQARFPAFSMAFWEYSVKGMCHADRVVAVSTNTAKDVEERLGIQAERITVIPNGVENSFRPLPIEEVKPFRQEYQRSPEEICFLNIGSTHKRKNIPTVFQVLKTLKERGMPVRLWRSGGKFMEEQIDFIKEHNLNSDILDFGRCDEKTLLQLYNAADFLLAPSLYEGFGLTVLEAMACGLPVLTSNVSSLPEVVGDGAIQVDPMDVTTLTQKITYLQQNPDDRDRLIQRGLLRAKQFSWRNAAQKLASVYESLV